MALDTDLVETDDPGLQAAVDEYAAWGLIALMMMGFAGPVSR